MNTSLDPRTAMIITLTGTGALAILSLAMSDVWGLVLAAALSLGLYFGGIKKLQAGDEETAKLACLVVTVVGGIIGLVTLFSGGSRAFIGLVDILVIVPAGYAWYTLQKM